MLLACLLIMQTYKDPDSDCIPTKRNICFHLVKSSVNLRRKLKPVVHCNTRGTVRGPVFAHFENTHTHLQSRSWLISSLQVGRREFLLARRVQTFARPRDTVSIVH